MRGTKGNETDGSAREDRVQFKSRRVLEPKRRVILTNTRAAACLWPLPFCLDPPSSRRCTAFVALGHFPQLEN